MEDRVIILGIDNGLGSIRIDVDDTYIDLYNTKGINTPVTAEDSKGNEKIQLSGLVSDGVISVYAPWENVKNRNGDLPLNGFSYIKIVCSDAKAEGKVTEMDNVENKLWLDDKEYAVSGTNRFDGASWNNITLGDTAAFYVNAYGKIVSKAEAESTWNYAFLIKPYFNDEDGVESMRICTSAGKVIKYNCVNPLRVNGIRVKSDIRTSLQTSAAYAGRGFNYSQVIKYKLNSDDAIDEIQTLTSSTGVAGGYSLDEQLSRDGTGTFKFLNDGEGHIVDGSGIGDRIIARYFPPELTLEVSAVENDTPDKYRLVSYKTQISDVDLDLYDVNDCTPTFAVRYVGGSLSNEMLLTGSNGTSATPVMFNESSLGLNEDDEVVLKFSVAQQGTVKEYYSTNLNLLNGVKCGQLMYLLGTNPTDTKVTAISLLESSTACLNTGIPINPDTLDQAWSINIDSVMTRVTPVGPHMSTYAILTEPYTKKTDTWFILQRGLTVSGSKKRMEQIVGSIRNAAYQKMGVLVWYENGGSPYCRSGNIDDIRFADEYGNDKASRIVTFIHEGTARGYAIYNYD